jgi:hypothetical protein
VWSCCDAAEQILDAGNQSDTREEQDFVGSRRNAFIVTEVPDNLATDLRRRETSH